MKQFTRGFTLVEILIVITVIAIIASMSVMMYTGSRERAKQVSVIADANSLEEALTGMQLRNGGVLSFGDLDADGEDDGYYTGDADNCGAGEVLEELNAELEFSPSGDNCLDVRLADSGREFCIRSYNPRAETYNSVFNAYTLTSLNDIDGADCQYETTLYSGGAVPGAFEEVYTSNATHTTQAGIVRIEVAVIGAGGSGNGRCGGGGGGVTTAVIENPEATYNITIGQPSPLGTNGGNGGSSSFGTITAGGGGNPNNGCAVLSFGTAGGSGQTVGATSQKYGAGQNGGRGGAYLLLGLLKIAPGGGGAGGGGVGASSGLVQGDEGGTGVYGFGGGGGGGNCSEGGIGGGAGTSAPAGNGAMGCNGGNGNGGNGSIGGGGGGSSNFGGAQPGLGGTGMVRVLSCYNDTCNPISTPVPD